MSVKKYINRKSLALATIVILVTGLLWIITQFGVTYLSEKATVLANNEAYATMENAVNQNVRAINQIVKNRSDYLAGLVGALSRTLNNGDTEDMQELAAAQEELHILMMGVIEKDQICTTTDGEVFDLSDYDFVDRAFQGEMYLSESWHDEDSGQMVNTFVIPIYEKEEISELLLLSYRSDEVADMFGFHSFSNGNGIRIIDSQGHPVIMGADMKMEPALADEFYQKEENGILKNFAEGGTGQFIYDYQGDIYVISYAPLGFQDWIVVFYSPYDLVYANVDLIKSLFSNISSMLLSVSLVFISIICGISMIFWRESLRSRYLDNVTKEGNERYFIDVILPRWRSGEKAVIALDIDQFKLINSTYGDEKGDDVLRHISGCFSQSLSEELYRISADKFFACVGVTDKGKLIESMERFRALLAEEIENGTIPYLKVSVGIAFCGNRDEFYRSRIDAMIEKRKIKGRYDEFYRFAEENTRKRAMEEEEIEKDFLKALKLNQIEAWYQPKYDGVLKRVVGAEALARWRKPDGSLMPPGMFIPVLEKSGQIRLLDLEVLRQVCSFQNQQRQQGKQPLPVSVNLSQQYITQLDTVDTILSILESFAIQPEDIIFELTETGLAQNNKIVQELIDAIHKKGFFVHMDDYGTGISGLKSLSEYDFDTIKLDKTFIDKIGSDKGEKILSSTIQMIESLNKGVIAEGVETHNQLEFLIEKGCRYIQGYYFSKPLCEAEYQELLCREEGNNE